MEQKREEEMDFFENCPHPSRAQRQLSLLLPSNAIASMLASKSFCHHLLLIRPLLQRDNEVIRQSFGALDTSEAWDLVTYIPYAEPTHYVIVVQLWQDGWRRRMSAYVIDQNSPESILIRICNIQLDLFDTRDPIMHLSTFAKAYGIIIEAEIVADFVMLENRPIKCYCALTDQEEIFWIRLIGVAGDYPSLQRAIRSKGVRAKRPCLLSLHTKNELSHIRPFLSADRVREGKKIFQLLLLANGEIPNQEAVRQLNELGLTGEMSPYWSLHYIVLNFFLHFYPDLMHTWFLGLVLFVLQAIGRDPQFGKPTAISFNAAISSLRTQWHVPYDVRNIGKIFIINSKRGEHPTVRNMRAHDFKRIVEFGEQIFKSVPQFDMLQPIWRLLHNLQRQLSSSNYTQESLLVFHNQRIELLTLLKDTFGKHINLHRPKTVMRTSVIPFQCSPMLAAFLHSLTNQFSVPQWRHYLSTSLLPVLPSTGQFGCSKITSKFFDPSSYTTMG